MLSLSLHNSVSKTRVGVTLIIEEGINVILSFMASAPFSKISFLVSLGWQALASSPSVCHQVWMWAVTLPFLSFSFFKCPFAFLFCRDSFRIKYSFLFSSILCSVNNSTKCYAWYWNTRWIKYYPLLQCFTH